MVVCIANFVGFQLCVQIDESAWFSVYDGEIMWRRKYIAHGIF